MIDPASPRSRTLPANAEGMKVLVVEGAQTLSLVLKQKIEDEIGVDVVLCRSLGEARRALASNDIILALTGHEIPDAPDGGILALLGEYEVPTILLSGSVSDELRLNYAKYRLADYIQKEGPSALPAVVAAVDRILTNRSVSILVVDDARAARSDLTSFLKMQNFRVIEATTGRQALDHLARDPSIEVVITDYFMPDMNGYDLTKRIRLEHGSDRLRIIGVSASRDRALSAQFLKAGASDFLYRPFVPEELQCRINNTVETLLQLKRLRHLAEHDPLTKLYNRRAFFERGARHLVRLEANQGKGAIAILDIDYFKRINDSFGHEHGDLVLTAVADILLRSCKERGVLAARLGGEEFALLLTDMTMAEAEAFCEALLVQVRRCRAGGSETPLPVTASIGLSSLQPGEPLDNQLNAADQMLYLAKSHGRDRLYSESSINFD